MRVTIDLMKKSTQIIDLSDVINPRVGDDDLLLPLHIVYGDNQTDMRGKDVEFISEDTNKQRIYVGGTCNTDTPGDNLYMGNLTFHFPAGTFKADGTYDPDKTMFRIVDKATNKVISSVNVKITVMKNNIEFDFDPDKSSYDSRAETMLQDFHDKGQAMLDEIKDLNNQAKSNVSGDTAATAQEAKKQADTNAGDISGLKGEVAGARGRYADLPGREDAQDTAIGQKETIVNANANYAALQQKDAQQDVIIANKAGKFELENKLSQMDLQPEAFENADALKAKYPNGKVGLMITTDTGHKWIWVNGAWKDCGVYQGVGIPDSSIKPSNLTNKASLMSTAFLTPLVVDFDKKTLTVPAGYHQASIESHYYLLAQGTSIIQLTSTSDDAKSEDLSSVFVALDFTNDILTQFKYFSNYKEIPDNLVYLGIIDFNARRLYFNDIDVVSQDDIWISSDDKNMSRIGFHSLPDSRDKLIDEGTWAFDWEHKTLTVSGFNVYVWHQQPFIIPEGSYDFSKSGITAFNIYLELQWSVDNGYKATPKFATSTDNLPQKQGNVWIGWADMSIQTYSISQMNNSFIATQYPWIDKKIACIGDSITAGDGGEGHQIDSYVPRLKKYTHAAVISNFGVNGSTITKDASKNDSFVERVGQIKDQDVVTIAGGVNDYIFSRQLGAMSDTSNSLTTFYGSLKYLIETLSVNNPKAKLMFLTPMKFNKVAYTYTPDGSLQKNQVGFTELDYVKAIKEVAEYYSIPVLDMWSGSNYNPYLPSQVGHDSFTADKLHPTAHGYERIAQTIGHAINAL